MTTTWAKPWDHKLDVADVFHDDNLTIKQKAERIAVRIRAAAFYDEDDHDLYYLVDELAAVETVAEFDEVWSAFYDWCDAGKRVWVVTR